MTKINLDYMKPTTLAAIVADLDDALATDEDRATTANIKEMLREIGNYAINADGLETLIGNIRRVDSRR